MRRAIAVAALGFALVGCGSAPEVPPVQVIAPAANPVLTVTGIVDGDTVRLSTGETVRVLGIDTPERSECGFKEASDFARATLLGKQVETAVDPTQDEKDFYERSLLYLSVDGNDYSTAAARAGWTDRYVFNNRPVQKDENIAAAVAAAKGEKAGIWGHLCVPPTPTPTPVATTTKNSPPPVVVANEDNDDRRRAPAPVPAPQPKPAPQPEPEPAPAYYKNCTAARAAGAAPVHRGEPGYGSHLDRDGDGVGCE